ncbi:MAG: hypothetical protein H0U77_00500 [Nocardioidaceae bacterium]|nr:hypothetical protein [Nocardioidaceae bacterium]
MSLTFDRDSIRRHPLTFSVLLIAAVAGVDVLIVATRDLLSLQFSVITTGIISGAVLSVLGALAIRRLGLWRELGLIGRPARRQTLLWCLPIAIYGVLPLTVGPDVTAGKVASAAAFGVLIAFWKLAVLGLVLYAWLPRGARAAAALTACSFAIMHLTGVVVGGVVVPTLVLSLSYLFLGFAFVAVRLRIRLLWPLACCYALLLTTAAMVLQDNEASNLAGSVSDVLPAVFSSLLLAGYGLIVWRRPRATAEPAGHLGDGPGVNSENAAGATHSPAARARRVVSTHD